MTKFQSLREQTSNLSFLSGGLDPTKLKATEKHTELLGKKTKYKVRSRENTLWGLLVFFFLCFVLFTFPSHSTAIKTSKLTNQENLKGLQIYVDNLILLTACSLTVFTQVNL